MAELKAHVQAQSKAQSKAHCMYCDSSDHDIVECPKDNDLDKILSSDENPHFEKCSLRILKKIATIVGIRSSYPKIQLALILQSTWAYKKKKRTEEIEKVKRELATLHMTSQIEECPICMDTIGQLGSSTTKCGHKFCTPCFIKTVTRKNTCPMCRTDIMEKTEYAESMKHVPRTDSIASDHIRRFVPPAAPPSAPPVPTAAHMYAYTFTEPIYPEDQYQEDQEEDPEEEALYQYQVQEYQALDQVQAQVHMTTNQSDIYIDRNPATLDLDECLDWLTSPLAPSAQSAPLAPAMPTSLRITPPNHNVIEALGIYTQQYNNNNTNLIP